MKEKDTNQKYINRGISIVVPPNWKPDLEEEKFWEREAKLPQYKQSMGEQLRNELLTKKPSTKEELNLDVLVKLTECDYFKEGVEIGIRRTQEKGYETGFYVHYNGSLLYPDYIAVGDKSSVCIGTNGDYGRAKDNFFKKNPKIKDFDFEQWSTDEKFDEFIKKYKEDYDINYPLVPKKNQHYPFKDKRRKKQHFLATFHTHPGYLKITSPSLTDLEVTNSQNKRSDANFAPFDIIAAAPYKSRQNIVSLIFVSEKLNANIKRVTKKDMKSIDRWSKVVDMSTPDNVLKQINTYKRSYSRYNVLFGKIDLRTKKITLPV